MPYAAEQDIQWPPNRSDIFIVTWKQHIYLFQIEESTSVSEGPKRFVIGSKYKFVISVLNIWGNNIYPQCVTWVSSTTKASLDVVPDHLIAVTLSGGYVRLVGFNRNTSFLAWNPWKRNLLAQGLDKPRNSREPSILIWDVTKFTGSRSANTKPAERDPVCTNGLHAHPYSLPFALTVSKKEWISDITVCDKSLCDLGMLFQLIYRGNVRDVLKVFDLSDPSKACQIITTRAVNGLTVDPLCSKRFASFCERQISIWRLDNLEKPVYTFIESGDIQQIKWSPLREAWLGVLLTDSCEPEQIPLERLLFPSSRSSVSLAAFSWHPSIVNCVLTLDRDGCMDVAHLVERAAIGWSANQTLFWSYSGDGLHLIHPDSPA
ncbi:unnamed protein product [Heterobilharzia americana]|nr:unnamed protein product [Heterobilharzia americana]